ncbi:hypothetical protein HMPREF6485_1023 [Segatella buccae ATCC 33574]|uniref:Uncharacterized protein n=1 Tax=Segatella buccae ATCC 33574 TaxID=873513 RepID=E6K617_9BACT|nr:hypothetical protein HMPREF6485_1023 [Segatella buccae ATCC 33574]
MKDGFYETPSKEIAKAEVLHAYRKSHYETFLLSTKKPYLISLWRQGYGFLHSMSKWARPFFF